MPFLLGKSQLPKIYYQKNRVRVNPQKKILIKKWLRPTNITEI